MASRGALLRDVGRLCNEVLATYEEAEATDASQARTANDIQRLQAGINVTNSVVAALEARKRAEAESSTVLASLQGAVVDMTNKRHHLGLATVNTRTARDVARAECHTAAISRTGAALEAGIVASAIGAIPVADCPSALLVAGRMQWWPVDAVALLHEVDALWKVVSCHSETLMDLLSGCLAAVGCDVDGLSASLAIDATTATNRAGAALYIATDTRLLDTDVAAAAVETERLVHLVDDLKARVASAASAVAVGDGLLYRDDTAALASSIPARELQPHIATAFAAVDAAVHSLEINMRLQTELLMVIQNNLHTLPPAQPAFVYENLDDLIAPLMAVSDTVVTRASSASVTSRASASQGDYTPLTF